MGGYMRKKWFVKKLNQEKFNDLKKEWNPVISRILSNRSIENVHKFLYPTAENSLHDPFLMQDMQKAVDLLIRALDEGSSIRIIGDYDQDGNSSVMTLLDGLGYFTENLSYDIPSRVEDGYGISKRLIDHAVADKVQYIITCDNGIAAHEQIAYAKQLGLTVIITDHHQVMQKNGQDILPEADAVINPQRADCSYPFKNLCGAGVAFKLVQAIFDTLGGDLSYLMDLLEYVCMGTICDVVDLLDENRFFVKEGLKRLNKTQNYGIQCLKKETSLKTDFNVYSIGFIIGPCINASGRLDTAKRGVQLLYEENMQDVERYAKELVALNNLRKDMTVKGFEKTIEIIEKNNYQNDDIIIVEEDTIHESIAGIIAGRIKEKYHRPCLVLTNSSEEDILKGSGRSIEEYDMFENFSVVKDLFLRFGGHAMACGLSIERKKVNELRKRINNASPLVDENFIDKIYLDSTLYISSLTFDVIEELHKLEPFGKGNPRPIFGDKNVIIKQCSLIGKNKNVLKMLLHSRGKDVEAILFQDVEEKLEYLKQKFGEKELRKSFMNVDNSNAIDICYYPTIHEFNGKKNIQLSIKDIR